MDLILPIIAASGAVVLLILGLVFKYGSEIEELFLFCMLFSTILFFVGGVMFLGVTYVDPVTGGLVADDSYNVLVYLFVPFGFIPILLMYEHHFDFPDT